MWGQVLEAWAYVQWLHWYAHAQNINRIYWAGQW